MPTLLTDTSPRAVARLAGLLYLVVIVFGMFAELYVGLTLVDPEDAATTADNIRSSEGLFRLGFMSGLLHHTCFLLVILVLFKLFRPVDRNLAWLMLALGLSPDQLEALTLVFLDLHSHGYYVAGLFSGLFLLPLGWLVLKSDRRPRFVGILLILGSLGYLTELLVSFVFPSYEVVAALGIAVAIAAELSFTFWLLFGRLGDGTCT